MPRAPGTTSIRLNRPARRGRQPGEMSGEGLVGAGPAEGMPGAGEQRPGLGVQALAQGGRRVGSFDHRLVPPYCRSPQGPGARLGLEQRRDLAHPALPLRVIQGQQLGQGPVQVPAQVGHLVMNPVHGVAGYPPGGGITTSCCRPQCTQSTRTEAGARPLIWL